MRVLILSQYYPPEPIPKPSELAKALVRRGHSVNVLTGLPNYPSGVLYPGFRRRLWQRDSSDGIPTIRAYEFAYHGRRATGRFLNYGSFAAAAVWASRHLPPCDVMYVWHPPLTMGIAAWLISRRLGIPFLYDVQDIWPESAVLAGVLEEGALVRAIARLERFVYARSPHIAVVTEGAKGNLVSKGVPATKVSVLPHWVSDTMLTAVGEETREETRRGLCWQGRFVALFAGNLGLLQGLDTLVEAATHLAAHERILIVMAGGGVDAPRLKAMAAAAGLGRTVQFLDARPGAEMPALLAAADLLLVHLKKAKLSHYVIPSKTLAYLAAGRPVLMAMEGAAADLVREAGAGAVVAAEAPLPLARAVLDISQRSAAERREMGQRGREFLRAHFSQDVVIPQYEAILARLAHANAGAPAVA